MVSPPSAAPPPAIRQVVNDAAHDLQQQILFAVNMVVEAADLQAHGRCHLAQGGCIVPALEKQFCGLLADGLGGACAAALVRSCLPPH